MVPSGRLICGRDGCRGPAISASVIPARPPPYGQRRGRPRRPSDRLEARPCGSQVYRRIISDNEQITPPPSIVDRRTSTTADEPIRFLGKRLHCMLLELVANSFSCCFCVSRISFLARLRRQVRRCTDKR